MLNQIVTHKKREVLSKIKAKPLSEIIKSKIMERQSNSLIRALSPLLNYPNIICEMKKASPSEGLLKLDYDPITIAGEFVKGGASAISILTDHEFFQGRAETIPEVRKITDLPILRKDFIVDEYQVYETKYLGADVILLIVSVLTSEQLNNFQQLAKKIGLESLVEIHSKHELALAIDSGAELIGINNRNLQSLEVSWNSAAELASKVPKSITKVVESGIYNGEQIEFYRSRNIHSFLIGTCLMKADNIFKKIMELKGSIKDA